MKLFRIICSDGLQLHSVTLIYVTNLNDFSNEAKNVTQNVQTNKYHRFVHICAVLFCHLPELNPNCISLQRECTVDRSIGSIFELRSDEYCSSSLNLILFSNKLETFGTSSLLISFSFKTVLKKIS